MTSVTTLKLTEPEQDLLDWLFHAQEYESRSQVFRHALLELAKQHGVPLNLVQRVRLDRDCHQPRRSALLAKKIGQRRKGEALKGGAV